MHIARIPRTAAALASVAAMMCATLAACAPSGGAAQSASREGTIAVGLPGSLSTLDAAHETGIINYYVAQVVSEGLLAVDKNGQLIPAIASSYHTDDAQTWVFGIRPDALFQDGNPVTIDDVLFSIDIAKDPDKSPSSASYWPAGVQAVGSGDNQITITLPAPAVNFGWTVTANGGLWITEKSFYEAAASYGSSTDLIMGTGPYKAVSFQPDSKAVFTKSGTWWGGDTPAQTIEFDFFSDENARLLAHKSGQIDIATQVPTDQVSQFQGIDGVNVLTESDRSYVGLTFDQNIAPFDDIHVRKAIAHAVDRDTIVSSILKGQASVATGIEPPDQLGSEIGEQAAADAQAGLPIDSFDLDAARAELAQSKVSGGFNAELTYPSSIPDLGSTALAIADNLKQIGVNLTVTSKPIEEWISEVGSGTYGLSFMSYTSTTGDPGEVAGWLLGPDNPARYENAQVQGLIVSQAAQTDPSARVADIVEAERIAQDNTIYSPIWWGKTSTSQPRRSTSQGIGSPNDRKASDEPASFRFSQPRPRRLPRERDRPRWTRDRRRRERARTPRAHPRHRGRIRRGQIDARAHAVRADTIRAIRQRNGVVGWRRLRSGDRSGTLEEAARGRHRLAPTRPLHLTRSDHTLRQAGDGCPHGQALRARSAFACATRRGRPRRARRPLVPARAVGRHAPTRRHRGRPRLRAGGAHRRRADDRPGCHDAARHPDAADAPARRPRHDARAGHPRPGARAAVR